MRAWAAAALGGGQEPPAQQPGAVVLLAELDPPALQAALVAFAGRVRVGLDDQPGQPGPQLSGGLLGRLRQHPVDDRPGGVVVVEHAHRLAQHPGLGLVDPAGQHRGVHGRQPDDALGGQVELVGRGHRRPGQRGGDLVGGEVLRLLAAGDHAVVVGVGRQGGGDLDQVGHQPGLVVGDLAGPGLGQRDQVRPGEPAPVEAGENGGQLRAGWHDLQPVGQLLTSAHMYDSSPPPRQKPAPTNRRVDKSTVD